jgi:hypothetical protein
MDSKGYISIEDLVRIINMEQGTFFRNRDLYLIFQRLNRKGGKGDTIKLNSLGSMLSNQ